MAPLLQLQGQRHKEALTELLMSLSCCTRVARSAFSFSRWVTLPLSILISWTTCTDGIGASMADSQAAFASLSNVEPQLAAGSGQRERHLSKISEPLVTAYEGCMPIWKPSSGGDMLTLAARLMSEERKESSFKKIADGNLAVGSYPDPKLKLIRM